MKKINKLIEILKTHKVYCICTLIILLSIVSILIQYVNKKNTMKVNGRQIINEENKIAIYITGEIKNPGVYYLEKNSRVENIIDICGGITDEADISKINLAQKLNDSDKIIIPKKEIKTTADIYQNEKIEDNSDKININNADKEELMSIPGVGEVTAKKIIEYRKSNYFMDIEDIKKVSGIGESKYNNIKEYICVE